MSQIEVQAVDFTSIHLYPDYWATGNLTFQLDFTAQFIAGHIAESAALQKPLIISEFGKYPPLADRNTYLQYVYGTAASSAASGGPLAGITFVVGGIILSDVSGRMVL